MHADRRGSCMPIGTVHALAHFLNHEWDVNGEFMSGAYHITSTQFILRSAEEVGGASGTSHHLN